MIPVVEEQIKPTSFFPPTTGSFSLYVIYWWCTFWHRLTLSVLVHWPQHDNPLGFLFFEALPAVEWHLWYRSCYWARFGVSVPVLDQFCTSLSFNFNLTFWSVLIFYFEWNLDIEICQLWPKLEHFSSTVQHATIAGRHRTWKSFVQLAKFLCVLCI